MTQELSGSMKLEFEKQSNEYVNVKAMLVKANEDLEAMRVEVVDLRGQLITVRGLSDNSRVTLDEKEKELSHVLKEVESLRRLLNDKEGQEALMIRQIEDFRTREAALVADSTKRETELLRQFEAEETTLRHKALQAEKALSEVLKVMEPNAANMATHDIAMEETMKELSIFKTMVGELKAAAEIAKATALEAETRNKEDVMKYQRQVDDIKSSLNQIESELFIAKDRLTDKEAELQHEKSLQQIGRAHV